MGAGPGKPTMIFIIFRLKNFIFIFLKTCIKMKPRDKITKRRQL